MVGRIVCDSEGHLNASSVLLEGSLQRMQGNSIKLDLSQLPSYRLFPGQVSHLLTHTPPSDLQLPLNLTLLPADHGSQKPSCTHHDYAMAMNDPAGWHRWWR